MAIEAAGTAEATSSPRPIGVGAVNTLSPRTAPPSFLSELKQAVWPTAEPVKPQRLETQYEVMPQYQNQKTNIIDQAKLEADRKSLEIVVSAIQQTAAEQSTEATVSVVNPNFLVV